MTIDKLADSKTRYLVDAQTVTVDVYSPLFVHGSKWPADMRGAEIGTAKVLLSGLTGITAVDVTLQDSEDGETWDDWKAFAQLVANGSAILDLDEERRPRRFVRAHLDVTGTGSCVISVHLNYRQVGPRGEYADGVRDVS